MTPDAPVDWFEEIDSTNEHARRLAQAGLVEPKWIAAHKQTAGRGRLGRHWVSPTGNLYVTALFLEPMGIPAATRYPFASGLAILDACRQFVPIAPLSLKWPNDVRSDRQKLCGILVEAGSAGGGAAWVACGMGINLQSAPEAAGQAATSLIGLGAPNDLNAEIFLAVLKPAFEKRCRQAREDFGELLRNWEIHAEGLGEEVTIGKGEDALRGRFTGLAPDGALLLGLPGGSIHTVRAGDVELVREVSNDAARD